MPKRSADRQWVNREDRVDRAWPRDHLPSGGARRPRTDAPKLATTPDAEAATAPEPASDGLSRDVTPTEPVPKAPVPKAKAPKPRPASR